MRSPRWIVRIGLTMGWVWLALGLISCPQTAPDRADQGKSLVDGYLCKRPPTIAECDAPPNNFSKVYYTCNGCTCAGPNPVAACNQSLGDCRHFSDGCYPKSYTLCDGNAPDLVSSMCLQCFLSDASGGEEKCDKLTQTSD